MPQPTAAEASVIVVTVDRHECVQRCLDCLSTQTEKPGQIIVVDASPNDLTRDVCSRFPQVEYLRNESGAGHLTQSRNIGLKASTGNIIAFIDDDAFAEPDWLANLVSGYRDETIGAVGGRALNNQVDEATTGVDSIGKLKNDGTLTGFFAADPGRIIEVDHIIGCSMSFRREVLAKLGGFREDFPGLHGLCEDTDMSFRVRRLGYRILFVPSARCLHIGAPQPKGKKRFDLYWTFYQVRNYTCLLILNYGLFSSFLANHMWHATARSFVACLRKIASGFAYLFANLSGILVGIFSGIELMSKAGASPVRSDKGGLEVTKALSAPVVALKK